MLDRMRDARAGVGAQLDAVETGNDVAALGTPEERSQWAHIAQLEEQLQAMPPGLDREETRDKVRLLKGVLYWQLDAAFKGRSYQEQRALRDIDDSLEELQNRWVRLQQARGSVLANTEDFSGRIAALAERVRSMRERLSQASEQQNQYLEGVAESELQAQKQRLDAYALQARFALADIYDRAADDTNGNAKPAGAAAPAPEQAPGPEQAPSQTPATTVPGAK